MSARDGFLAAILADPGDDLPRQAYADWLRETDAPHDEAHGRFLAAGLALHRAPAPEDGNEGPFYDALAAQDDTAPAVIGAQAAALLGWGDRTWAWDNDAAAPGRVTARRPPEVGLGPTTARAPRLARRNPPPGEALVYERGCVAGARLFLRTWRKRGRGLLERCPLERLEVLDVPGLWVAFDRPGPDRWRAVGRLVVPRRPERHEPFRGLLTPGAPPGEFEEHWPTAGCELVTRAQLCQAASGLVWWLASPARPGSRGPGRRPTPCTPLSSVKSEKGKRKKEKWIGPPFPFSLCLFPSSLTEAAAGKSPGAGGPRLWYGGAIANTRAGPCGPGS